MALFETSDPDHPDRRRLLKPRQPTINEDVWPGYHLLVPHDCQQEWWSQTGLQVAWDIATRGGYTLTSIGTFDPNTPLLYQRDTYECVQWMIDVLQLARTCKHAYYWLDVGHLRKTLYRHTHCPAHNDIVNSTCDVLTKPQRLAITHFFDERLKTKNYYTPGCLASWRQPWLTIALTAFYDRLAVAEAMLEASRSEPASWDLNLVAWRDLGRVPLPMADLVARLAAYRFDRHPFMWPHGMAGNRKGQQVALWLAMANELGHFGGRSYARAPDTAAPATQADEDTVARALFGVAAAYADVRRWLKRYECELSNRESTTTIGMVSRIVTAMPKAKIAAWFSTYESGQIPATSAAAARRGNQ